MVEILNKLGFKLTGAYPQEHFLDILLAVAWLVLGLVFIRLILLIIKSALNGKIPDHPRKIIQSMFFYSSVFVLILLILGFNGINLTPLLGAAGIIGIAVGIASQTSLSNIISGIFLLIEKPFGIGDVI